MKKHLIAVFWTALVLALSLAACGGENTAAVMHLVRTEGMVWVDNAEGKDVKISENLGLYSGYEVNTQAESYGWITLDDAKLAKLDASSAVEIRKNDKLLELYVLSGGLFFNVTEPLAEDEVMNIRTSAMAVGIRGTCGWVDVENENLMYVYLLEGKVECSIFGENGIVLASETITAGQTARMVLDGDEAFIVTEEYDAGELPAFVEDALENPESWNIPGNAEDRDVSEDAKEHVWAEATCFTPKTCSECGETEGDRLPHEFTEATYQSPATCKVCGTTDGEMLQGDFDKHGLICSAELDKEYPYTTLTYRNKDISVNGTVLFSNYRIFESDEEHEGVEGYEWKSVDVTFTYAEDNAWDYGTTSSPFTTDFYNIVPKNVSGANKNESNVGVIDENDTYTINFNGIDYTECLNEDHALVMEWNDRVYTCKIQVSFRVPIGYDGSIVGVISDGRYNDGDYIYEVADENTLFFRLK